MRDRAGLTNIFTLSGNHIMPLFDAAIGTRLNLIHSVTRLPNLGRLMDRVPRPASRADRDKFA
jgi:hypothetical protein